MPLIKIDLQPLSDKQRAELRCRGGWWWLSDFPF